MTRSAIIRPRRAAAAAIAAVCLFLPVPGQAAGTPAIVSPPGNTFTDYHPAVIERGDELTYVHLDPTGGHDVTATCEYLRGPNDPPGGPFTKPGPGCGVVVGADNADHCFRREMPFPALGEAWDPSQAAFYYVHKDAYAHPNYTGPAIDCDQADGTCQGPLPRLSVSLCVQGRAGRTTISPSMLLWIMHR